MQLLKADVPWHWDENLTLEFIKIMRIITETPVLRFLDKTRDIVVSADACSYGVGGILLQEGYPVAYASATQTSTQLKYAQIEKELLAIYFAL